MPDSIREVRGQVKEHVKAVGINRRDFLGVGTSLAAIAGISCIRNNDKADEKESTQSEQMDRIAPESIKNPKMIGQEQDAGRR